MSLDLVLVLVLVLVFIKGYAILARSQALSLQNPPGKQRSP